MEIKTYSDKSFVVIGEETRKHINSLKALGGKFNPNLTDSEGNKFAGWIFSNKKKEEVEKFLVEVKEGTSLVMKPSSKLPIVAKTPSRIEKPQYQTVTYKVLIPKVGQSATITIGSDILKLKVALVESSRNNGIFDTVYVSEDATTNEMSLLKIVNGDWKVIGILEESDVVFE